MNLLKELLYWTWCLPQTLLGLILNLIFRGIKVRYLFENKVYEINQTESRWLGGVSLGKYIMLGKNMDSEKTIKHEYGHQIQSFVLGPLFLIVIGLPSLFWCWFVRDLINKIRKKIGKQSLSYYWFYTEKWANKLGGVIE